MKLDINTRGISHYNNLKKDFQANDGRILDSLPLFYRIMFLDEPNPWIKEINRFDFLRLYCINKSTNYINLDSRSEVSYRLIEPTSKNDIKEVSTDDFFSLSIITIRDTTINIHDFLLALAYNGAIHMIPTKNKELQGKIYENIFLKHPEKTLRIANEISSVILDVFDELSSYFTGKSDGISPNRNFQPMIIREGKLLDGTLYRNAYMQFPVLGKKNKGIRVLFDLKIKETKKNRTILNFGHRYKNGLNFSIWQSGKYMNVKVMSANGRKVFGQIDISNVFDQFFDFEIAIYPNGKVSCSINQILKISMDLETNINTISGKIILGANLNGNSFGELYNKELIIQSIDKNDMTNTLNIFKNERTSILPQRIPYNILKRNK